MNAVEELPVDTPVATEAVGDRLRGGRERRGLSIADIAQTLKFSARQVELIEANAWAELPGPTFVRGCVRAYAKFLQIDPEPLLRDLDSANLPKQAELAAPGSTNATLPMPGRSGGGDRLAVVAGLLLVVAALAAYFLLPADFWNRPEAATPTAAAKSEAPSSPAAAPTPPAIPPSPAADTVAVAAAPPTDVPTAVPSLPVATPVMPPPSEPASAENRIRFEFTRPSWVEVRDANGVLLHSQNNAAGTTQEISGALPMAIVVGDVSGVRMVYRDKPVDLSAYTRPGSSVARLNVE